MICVITCFGHVTAEETEQRIVSSLKRLLCNRIPEYGRQQCTGQLRLARPGGSTQMGAGEYSRFRR